MGSHDALSRSRCPPADEAVRMGKARYIGISNYCGWQTAAAASWQSSVPGRSPVAATQVEYSLLQRGIEREVVSAAQQFDMGVVAWSPLGRGVLTGKYRTGTPADSRAASAHFTEFVRPFLDERCRHIVDAVVDGCQRAGRFAAGGRARLGTRPSGRDDGRSRRPYRRPAARLP